MSLGVEADAKPVNSESFAHTRFHESEHIDIKDAWKAVFVNRDIVTMTMTLFWAYLFFDMLSNGYGWDNGLISSFLFILCWPFSAYACAKSISSSWTTVRLFEQ
jgi:hypothetical protein